MKQFHNTLAALACASTLLAVAAPATAATLSLQPATASVMTGSSFFVDVVIDGLAIGSAPSLGAFDTNVTFDQAALSFTGYTLGTSLGLPDALEVVDASLADLFAGNVNVAAVSLLSSAALDSLQGDAFVLATLEFSAIGSPGTTTLLQFGASFLANGPGDPLTVDGTAGASISITAVPLPAAAWLLLSAFGGLLTIARVRR